MRPFRVTCVALSVAAGGCHTFQPIEFEELAPGMEVRARVSSSRAAELSRYLPTEDDRLIEGTVLSAGPTGLFLLVGVTARNVPGRMETLSQRLEIPFTDIFEVEQKELDRWKTGLVAAGGGLVTGFVLYQTLLGGSSGEPPGPGEPGTTESIVLFTIPIGR